MPDCQPSPTPAEPRAHNVTFVSAGSHGLPVKTRLQRLLRTALRAHGLRAVLIQPATPAGKPIGDPMPIPDV